MIAPRFDTLPPNLPAGRRYVVWRDEQRPGRNGRGKVPYQPARPLERASVTKPSTWGTFATARDQVDAGQAHGLGLVLVGDVVAIDLDRCLDVASRELTPAAAAIVRDVASYTEVSPSGRGLHLLAAAPCALNRRCAGVECYTDARYITLTGAHLADTPRRIEACPTLPALLEQWFPTPTMPAIATAPAPTLDDQALVEKAHRARNGRKFAALWRGDTSHYPSHSEADADLCRQLSFWTARDPVRVDRLFRQSGLMRLKWDSPRGESTYGAETVAFAIRTTYQVYTPGPAELEVIE